MSDEEKKATPPAPAAPVKTGVSPVIFVVTAVAAGAAAFGGAKFAVARAGTGAAQAEVVKHEAKPPGPTLQLEPFLVTVVDAQKKQHPMKVTLAVEFDHAMTPELMKDATPRSRDACLRHLRTITYEDAVDLEKSNKLREDLSEQLEKSGVYHVEQVLITDYVVQ